MPSEITVSTKPWKVKDLIELKQQGRLHLPDLQRGFRWTPERVRALFDSLYRQYPVGALLLWKPNWEGDDPPFLTRPWELFPPNTVTGRGERESAGAITPGSYFVLDGQQRLTGLFQVIFNGRRQGSTAPAVDLQVALSLDAKWIDNPFHLHARALRGQRRDGLLVSAEVMFGGGARNRRGDSLEIGKAIGEWVKMEDRLYYQSIDRANEIRNDILNAEIIAYELDADVDDDNVIEIFARLNLQGVRLNPGDLAAARLTGIMEDFRGRARAVLAAKEFAGFTANSERRRMGAFVDTDLLVRTSMFLGAGLLAYHAAEKRKDKRAVYSATNEAWDDACSGLQSAVQILRDAGIPSGAWIPYRYLLLVPAVAIAKGHSQTPQQWLAWIIVASLWGHYSVSAETTAQGDAKVAVEGDFLRLIESVKQRAKRTDSVVPEDDDFTGGVVLQGGALLALLVALVEDDARSPGSRRRIASHAAAIDVHHIFPRALLDRHSELSVMPDRLGNLTLVFADDNQSLGDTPPAEYLRSFTPEILAHHCIPSEPSLWEPAMFDDFCVERERLIAQRVRVLLKRYGLNGRRTAAETVEVVA
jgi:hypothetical protein